jgi:hypothetical protein
MMKNSNERDNNQDPEVLVAPLKESVPSTEFSWTVQAVCCKELSDVNHAVC